MTFLNKILFLCTAFIIPIEAFPNTDDYDRCIIMNKSKITFKFNITNKDTIFAEYPSYKKFYENYLNNPLEQKCGWKYSTGVGCDCNDCNVGDKLSECVTPKQYQQACAETIAFAEMEHHYREEWLQNQLEKICGPAPSEPAASEKESTSPNEQSPQKSDDQTKSDKKSAKAAQRKAKKEAECKAKNPPMDVKQNALGLWVCTDNAETIAAREQQRQANATLKTFWNDMDDLERAFNRRVKQLRKGGD